MRGATVTAVDAGPFTGSVVASIVSWVAELNAPSEDDGEPEFESHGEDLQKKR
jgi:hypothetical protein